MRFPSALIPLFTLIVASAHALHAQTADTSATAAVDVRLAVDSLVKVLRNAYVDADTAALIADHVLQRLRERHFEGVSRDTLAARLTDVLRATNGDKHLAVIPTWPPNLLGGPAADSITGPLRAAAIDTIAILDGNVGYFRLRRMVPASPDAAAALRVAMETVKDVDALIIDVRGNRGGAPATGAALWTYLAAAGQDSIPALHVKPRNAPARQGWSRPVQGTRPRPDIPLYILTARNTGSAAEGFTFFLQQSGRAQVIGQPTAGAGHLAAPFPIGQNMTLLLSTARVMFGENGPEWERTGVQPDVLVDEAAALDRALSLARQRIGSG